MLERSPHRYLKLARRLFARRIRYKVLAAAMVVVAVIGAIGWIGFRYINAVARTVTVTTQRTAPLLANALTASEATRRLMTIARDTDRVCAIEAGVDIHNSNPLWRGEFGAIERLASVATSAGLQDRAVNLGDASRALYITLTSITDLCRETRQAKASLKAKEGEALQILARLSATITDIGLVLDGEMTLNEEHAKVALQADRIVEENVESLLSHTLLDTWPTLRGLYRLREYADRLKETVNSPVDVVQLRDLDVEASQRAEALSVMRGLAQRVTPRLRALGRDKQAEAVAQSIASAEDVIKGIAGVEELRHALQDLDLRANGMEGGLTRIEEKLATEMRRLEREARALDAAAQQRMRETIDEAMLVIGLVAGLAALGTLLAALGFTDRLTRPIEALTAHTRTLQETQDVDRHLPPGLIARRDEIGRLAHSFNDTIAALAEARRRLLAQSEAEIKIQFERLKTAIEGMPQGVYLLGADKRLLLSNARFAALYDLTPAQIAVGVHSDEIASACRLNGAGIESEAVENLSASREDQPVIRRHIRTLDDGRIMVVTVTPTFEGGEVVVHEDVTERRRAEDKIAHMAHHDALTGLANRTLFREQISDSLFRLRPEHSLAVLYIDLDHFKAVNDTLGHPAGDRLLIMASRRLGACLRDDDHITRLGGDEFAVVLNGDPTPDEVETFAERIIQSVGQPYNIDGQQVVIGVSIGIALAPNDGEEADRLMKSADMALYRAKKEGRNTHHFFEAGMDARMQERRTLELALREAIASEGLMVYYQPLVNIKTNQVEEFEALLRWPDSARGLISPEVFIPLAEETGLINEISSWVLRQACQDAMKWPDHIRVAVNISPLQFRTRTLVLNVISALEASGLAPDRLELEITEGVLLHDTQSTLQTLKQLQDIGVRIAMDDFGTGYSSLSYLRKFNFNKVKIDRSFVSALDQTKDSRAIIRAVSGLCSSLGIEITAEGVETEAQLHTLREEGCTQVQGYLLGRPGPISSVPAYFGESRPSERKA